MAPRSKRQVATETRTEVEKLMRLAADVAVEHPDRAQRYATLAHKLASRKRISLGAYNRQHCRKCFAWFTTKTLRVRVRATHTVYACLTCGHMTRLRKK